MSSMKSKTKGPSPYSEPTQRLKDLGLEVKFGCDPEFFLFDKETNQIVPAVGKVKGTKESPFAVPGGTVQLDGTVLEVGTDPASTADEFVQNLKSVLRAAQEMVGDRYLIKCGAIGGYTPESLEGVPSTVFDVGCSPQFSIKSDGKLYRMRGLQKLDPKEVPIGGHVHLGWTSDEDLTDALFLKDCFHVARLYESGVYKFCQGVGSNKRSQIIARRDSATGESFNPVRIKPYGLEFRKLDSFWCSDERLLRFLYSEYIRVLDFIVQATTEGSGVPSSIPDKTTTGLVELTLGDPLKDVLDFTK